MDWKLQTRSDNSQPCVSSETSNLLFFTLLFPGQGYSDTYGDRGSSEESRDWGDSVLFSDPPDRVECMWQRNRIKWACTGMWNRQSLGWKEVARVNRVTIERAYPVGLGAATGEWGLSQYWRFCEQDEHMSPDLLKTWNYSSHRTAAALKALNREKGKDSSQRNCFQVKY